MSLLFSIPNPCNFLSVLQSLGLLGYLVTISYHKAKENPTQLQSIGLHNVIYLLLCCLFSQVYLWSVPYIRVHNNYHFFQNAFMCHIHSYSELLSKLSGELQMDVSNATKWCSAIISSFLSYRWKGVSKSYPCAACGEVVTTRLVCTAGL